MAATATPIESDMSMRSIFKEKVEQIWRDLNELKVSFGVDACAVIYGPNNGAPEVWPPSSMDFRRVMAKFFGVPPEAELTSRFVAKVSQRFLKAKIRKTREELEPLQRENRVKELKQALADGIDGAADMSSLTTMDLMDMVDIIDEQTRKIEELLNNSPDVAEHQAEPSEQITDDVNDDEVPNTKPYTNIS